jgi:hypothetical protein
LAVIFTLVGSVVSALITPAFARCERIGAVLRLLGLTLVGYTLFVLSIGLISLVCPAQLLWLLGARYASLEAELPWFVFNSVVMGYSSVFFSLSSARGWVWHSWMLPLLTLLSQGLLLTAVDLNTIKGVLIFSMGAAGVTFAVSVYTTSRGLWTSWKAGRLAPPGGEFSSI